MDKKTAICQYLKKYHTGGERAVYSRELQRLFSIDGRGLRRKINSLRQDGYPICSDKRGLLLCRQPGGDQRHGMSAESDGDESIQRQDGAFVRLHPGWRRDGGSVRHRSIRRSYAQKR